MRLTHDAPWLTTMIANLFHTMVWLRAPLHKIGPAAYIAWNNNLRDWFYFIHLQKAARNLPKQDGSDAMRGLYAP